MSYTIYAGHGSVYLDKEGMPYLRTRTLSLTFAALMRDNEMIESKGLRFINGSGRQDRRQAAPTVLPFTSSPMYYRAQYSFGRCPYALALHSYLLRLESSSQLFATFSPISKTSRITTRTFTAPIAKSDTAVTRHAQKNSDP